MELFPVKRVLLIMKSESYKAADFIAAARKLNFDLVIGSDQPQLLSELGSDRALGLDFNDPGESVRRIVSFHLERAFSAVVAAEDEGTVIAARAAHHLGLRGNPEEGAVAARDKSIMREVLASAGIAAPWFRRYGIREDPAGIAEEVPFPCVLKPLHLSGSRGVIRADNAPQFVAAFQRIAAILADADAQERGTLLCEALLVESFIPGAEISLEGLLDDGEFKLLAFFDKPDPLDGPYFEETLFVTPSRHSPALQAAAQELAGKSARALGLRSGAVHAELRIDGDRVSLLEIAPRPIGGHCSRILQFGSGVSLEEIVLCQAMGIVPSSVEREGNAAGVMMIPIPSKGNLLSVTGLESAKKVQGVQGVEITIARTQEVVPLPEGHRYLGFIFAKADTVMEVEQALREAHSRLEFKIG